jgi:alpha/beta superfamily hydrolase
MNKFDGLIKPGTYKLIINGLIGDLEVELIIPNNPNFDYIAFLGHPHSLQGGTMQNKVVTTLGKAFAELNIPSIKFNFRGVGNSIGEYDAGIGESMDMLELINYWKKIHTKAKVLFAGFSFGSYVSYRAAAIYKAQSGEDIVLITIAPSVNKYDYVEYDLSKDKWLVIHGDSDEIADFDDVYNFTKKFQPPLELIKFSDTTHFFHGKLIELKNCIVNYISKQLLV